ncbi:hypothetical protein IHQ68_03400 [Chelatococcus sambhunathii]|uniref:Uncharacterized protein n=1 Tax=Chelatococcus sambhunathii TaxID=363953 RepID=A0ABU1DCA6_9HYPH|nr:hypothetical protein [Chelatococcus sambhunathii]MDR4305668.1 hypothetical protein [Chelatococcus sambhunathii]
MTARRISGRPVGASLIAATILAGAATAQPYDDRALLRQLGFVAGQAVICRLDPPEVASLVMRRIADGWGYGDEETRALLDETSRDSQIGGCTIPDAEGAAKVWRDLKLRANVD